MKRNWDDDYYLVGGDNSWQAQMRARQSWYRQIILGLEAGIYLKKERGNYLSDSAPQGSNFLNEEIARYIEEWLPYAKKDHAMVDEDRLRRNMLSSQPLSLNLFVPLAHDLDLASAVLGKMTDERVDRVTGIKFEYSPGRGKQDYSGDGSAHDVYVRYTNRSGGAGFLGIEVKYHERLSGDDADYKERYDQVAEEMGCFRETCYRNLHEPPLGQIWRNHLLAGSQQIADGLDDALSVLLYPAENEACTKAAAEYRDCLTDSSSFEAWTIDEMVARIREIRPSEWIESFHTRYLSSDYLADKQASGR